MESFLAHHLAQHAARSQRCADTWGGLYDQGSGHNPRPDQWRARECHPDNCCALLSRIICELPIWRGCGLLQHFDSHLTCIRGHLPARQPPRRRRVGEHNDNNPAHSAGFLPLNPSFAGYEKAIADQGGNLLTSLIISIGTVVVTLVIAAPAAYAL